MKYKYSLIWFVVFVAPNLLYLILNTYNWMLLNGVFPDVDRMVAAFVIMIIAIPAQAMLIIEIEG